MSGIIAAAKVAIAICIVAALAVILLLYLFQERLIFPAPDVPPVFKDDGVFSPVEITTSDGETLFALHHPSEKNEPTIIVFHGNGDAAIYQTAKGYSLAAAGFGVLLAEYRGYPGSTGKPTQEGLFTDARAAYDYIAKSADHPIGLYAHSLGTGVAVKLASEREVFAVVLEAPYDSISTVAKRRYPGFLVDLLLKHSFPSVEFISQVKAPILMIHGSNDTVIPIEHGETLFKNAPQNARFVEVESAEHNNLEEFEAIGRAIEFFIEMKPR